MARQIDCLRQIGDTSRAVDLARQWLKQDPENLEREKELILSLASSRVDGEAARRTRDYFKRADVDWNLAEKVAWSSLQKGAIASSLTTRIASLLGAIATQDIQAVDLICQALRAKEVVLRGVALELAPKLRDKPIQIEVERLIREEKVRAVRLAAIKAAALMQMSHALPLMREIAADKKASLEERLAAVIAAAELMEDVEDQDLLFMATHPRAGMRMLACEAIGILDKREKVDLLLPLLADLRPDVRISALNCVSLLFPVDVPLSAITPLLKDADPSVAITAAYVVILMDGEGGKEVMAKYIRSKRVEEARLAAAALAQTGEKGLSLAQEMLRSHADPYVRATLALGLLGQRVLVDESLAHLYTFCVQEKEPWMWKTFSNGRFRALVPSTLGLNPRLPGARETVDQLTRLEILNVLAIFEHPRAEGAVKQFLGDKRWGVTGVAAITLLEEGGPGTLDLIRKLLDDPDEKVRVQAALGLALWGGDPSVAKVLEEAYPVADRELKIKMLEAIGKIGSRDSLPFLLGTLDEPFDTLRVLTASALIQCLNH